MKRPVQKWVLAVIIFIIVALPVTTVMLRGGEKATDPWSKVKKHRTHFSHSPVFNEKFERPQDVTLACLKCHENTAADFMKTAHWRWARDGAKLPGRQGEFTIGKKNLPNNFCLGVQGNEKSCNSCHAGYGWKDKNFDFNKAENVDCLICDDWSGGYSESA